MTAQQLATLIRKYNEAHLALVGVSKVFDELSEGTLSVHDKRYKDAHARVEHVIEQGSIIRKVIGQ